MLLSWSLTTLPGRSRRGLNLRVCCESHLSSATIPHCSPVYQNHLSTKVTCLLSPFHARWAWEVLLSVNCWVLSENCLTDGMWQKTEKSWACCKSNVSIAGFPSSSSWWCRWTVVRSRSAVSLGFKNYFVEGTLPLCKAYLTNHCNAVRCQQWGLHASCWEVHWVLVSANFEFSLQDFQAFHVQL